MNPLLLALLIYSFILITTGLFLSRRVTHSLDFFVADRKLGPGLLFSTLLAANIGAGSTVGAAGLGYQLGLSGWWWVGSAGLGSVILAFVVGPRIRDLAERWQFLTVGDFLEFRYNRAVRALSALLLWAGTLAILAGQLIAVAWILGVVVGTTKSVGCLLGGLVVVVYFSAGGLKGTVWINLVQLLVKASAFLLAVPLALSSVGGWSALRRSILEQEAYSQSYFNMTGIGLEGILAYLVLLVPAFIVSPGLLQKVYGARSTRAVRIGVGANAGVLFIYAFFPVLLGMSAAAVFPNLGNPELALPYVMTELLPLWLGALLLAGVFSAEISSADAVLFMLSTSLSKDLYQTFIRPELDEQQLLRISRYTSAVAGVLAVALAIVLPSVISALTIFYSLISVTFFAPVVFGLYSGGRGGSCLAVIIISVIATAVVHVITAGSGIWIFSPTALGILLSVLLMSLGMAWSRSTAHQS
ncbi:sodium:solute symporter family protein [Acidobacteria bacterium AH-259-L09]|nr:sodium:solute symporter family protein [Acidobacteria bacterium AH-259-L09]